MAQRKHHLTKPLTVLAVMACALTTAGTLGVPRDTPDPIGAPATSTPVNAPAHSSAIFDDPLGF